MSLYDVMRLSQLLNGRFGVGAVNLTMGILAPIISTFKDHFPFLNHRQVFSMALLPS